MNAHIAARSQHRLKAVPLSADLVMPPILGLCYGAWVGWVMHNHGTELFRAQMYGLAAAGILTALCYGISALQHHVIPELRAAMYGAVFGAVMGYGYRITGSSILKGSLYGLMFGVIGGAIAFYLVHTHEPVSQGDLATARVQERDRQITSRERIHYLAAEERGRMAPAAGEGAPGAAGRAVEPGTRPGIEPGAGRGTASGTGPGAAGGTDLGPTSTGR
ncbi:hypothetical protein ACZ90_07160 [Streptomyces albus subsp. albus]|nr:hypothetical protein ACZ90_07160 [Streptomyces albus subsp. albus]